MHNCKLNKSHCDINEKANGMEKKMIPKKFCLSLVFVAKLNIFFFFLQISYKRNNFYFTESVETSRWTEEEMEIAKQGELNLFRVFMEI